MGRTVRFGVHAGQQNLPMDELRALWRRLDGVVDWVSCWDHLYEAPPLGGTMPHYEALTVLGALAADTRHVRIGCLVFYVGYRTPGVLAKAATTLDHISGGRFEIGLGGGWHDQEAAAFGYDFPGIGTRLDMLEEAVTIIRGLLTQDRTTFHGRHFHVEDASCLPRPVQERLPIWIGGIGEKRTLRLVARHADGWNTAYISPEDFARKMAVLDQWCEGEGRDPATVRRAINLTFNLSTTEAGARALEQRLRDQWGAGYERVAGGGLMGLPRQAVDRIGAYLDAGAQDVNIALRAPWDAEALESYLTDVLPQLRGA
jgi:alkanesulfonate monooxygenase SsuD/methylene tetrahydromethanopterin reductase-like flavin-dependent oxidoreductase (luciferase family)